MRPCGHPECRGFGVCAKICPKGLIKIIGETVDSDALSQRLKSYERVFNKTGGGVTISGGEPLFQPEFLVDLLQALKPLHIVLETSGHGDEAVFVKSCELADIVYFDFKLADAGLHKKYTGMDNELILSNLKLLIELGLPFVLRMPLIPGVNDNKEHFRAAAELIYPAKEYASIELLPYNPFANAKYKMLGKKYETEFVGQGTDNGFIEVMREAGISFNIL